MSILARYQNMLVEVLDVFTDGAGDKWASIEAQDGKPFVGGDKWPVRTQYATVKVAELSKAQENGKPNLLDLALAQAKPQWSNGESVWLVRNGTGGAFLKNDGNGFVTLSVTGCREYLNVFYLDPNTWTWQPARDLVNGYKRWASKAQEALK